MKGNFPLEFVRDFFGGPGDDLPFRMVLVFGVTVVPRVVFYDRRFIDVFPQNGDHGQQINAYYLDTMLEDPTIGINLDGGVDAWTITPHAFRPLQDFMLNVSRQWLRATGMESANA